VTVVSDTNAYSAFCRNDETVVSLFENADAIVVPSIVVGELVAGFLGGSQWDRNWALLAEFLAQPGIRVQDIGIDEAQRYGLLVKNLKQRGTPIPTNDLWIAATALSLGAALVTRDKHFSAIEGLFVLEF
jgi:tRNA(fMet)-specific endonuclease VapC